MSTDFVRSNPALEKAIAACQTKEQLADVLLRHQQANGLPNATDRVALPSRTGDSSSQHAEAPKNEMPLLRRAVTIGNITRCLEAYSTSGLDYLEGELRKQS
jgi:hypothetical protein